MIDGLVLHDLGDEHAGAPWRAALAAHADVAHWAAPDLPGHGTAPAPRSGAYDPMAAVTLARRHLATRSGAAAVVVGVGANAHAALVLAAGDGCRGVVVVDGLHEPFRSPEEDVEALYAGYRALVTDRAATGPAPAAGLDPRTRYGYGVSVSPAFLQRFWGAVTVPVLVLETPRSPTPPEERRLRAGWFGATAAVVELSAAAPEAVVAAIAPWGAALDGR